MKQPKTIFFIGNGFSQGLGFPETSELWERSFEPSSPLYKRVLALDKLKSLYPVSRFLEDGKEIRELELLLTVWSTYCEAFEYYPGLAGDLEKWGRREFEAYVQNLCNWLLRFTSSSIKTSLFQEFVSFLKDLTARQAVSFITTNYDLLLEAAVSQAAKPYVFFKSTRPGAIPIRKLHGSVSWFCSQQPIAGADGTEENIFQEEEGVNKGIKIWDHSSQCLKMGDLSWFHQSSPSQTWETKATPLTTIIPPIIGKKYH